MIKRRKSQLNTFYVNTAFQRKYFKFEIKSKSKLSAVFDENLNHTFKWESNSIFIHQLQLMLISMSIAQKSQFTDVLIEIPPENTSQPQP